MMDKRKLIGDALAELIEESRTGGPRVRIGLMAAGSELGQGELLRGAVMAAAQDPRLQVVAIGAKAPGYGELEWVETPNSDADVAAAMESALADGRIDGAVALHYPFPLGVTTIGRILTPARGKPMLIASSTGMAATSRVEAMLRNAIYGIAVAKALDIEKPTVGILNLEGAVSVQRALSRLSEGGYAVHLGSSVRAEGGALLRGNDLLAGGVDVCVCDTLTGNVLVKLFSAFNTGGSFEALGWGYGPSVGEGWGRVVSIISRASGAPVIANALCCTAALIRGKLVECVQGELNAAKAAGVEEIISSLSPKAVRAEEVPAPPQVPTDSEIHGIDVLSIEVAVKVLWKVGIYAESSMGCTGPVVKVSGGSMERSMAALREAGYL